MISVRLPDGTVAKFPEGTSKEVMEEALNERFGSTPEKAREDVANAAQVVGKYGLDAIRSGAAGAVKGVASIADLPSMAMDATGYLVDKSGLGSAMNTASLAMGGAGFVKKRPTYPSDKIIGGLENLFGKMYEPQTELGELSKKVGMYAAPAGVLKAPLALGAAQGVADYTGTKVGDAVLPDSGQIAGSLAALATGLGYGGIMGMRDRFANAGKPANVQGVPLTAAQKSGNPEMYQFERQALLGQAGNYAQERARGFDTLQQTRLRSSILGAAPSEAITPVDAASNIKGILKSNEQAAKAAMGSEYAKLKEFGASSLLQNDFVTKNITNNLRRLIPNMTSNESRANVSNAIDALERYAAEGGTSLNDLMAIRKNLSAASVNDGSLYDGVSIITNAIEEASKNPVMATNKSSPDVIKAFSGAISKARDYYSTFDDPAFTSKVLNNADAERVAVDLFGNGRISPDAGTRLKQIINASGESKEDVRKMVSSAVVRNIVDNSVDALDQTRISPAKLRSNIQNTLSNKTFTSQLDSQTISTLEKALGDVEKIANIPNAAPKVGNTLERYFAVRAIKPFTDAISSGSNVRNADIAFSEVYPKGLGILGSVGKRSAAPALTGILGFRQ